MNCQAKAMAEIKLLVLCVAMVVVCLELEQGQAQGDVQFSVKHSIKLCGPANGCLPIIYHFGANLHRIKYLYQTMHVKLSARSC